MKINIITPRCPHGAFYPALQIPHALCPPVLKGKSRALHQADGHVVPRFRCRLAFKSGKNNCDAMPVSDLPVSTEHMEPLTRCQEVQGCNFSLSSAAHPLPMTAGALRQGAHAWGEY